MKGSPVYPLGQLQVTLCCLTSHTALANCRADTCLCVSVSATMRAKLDCGRATPPCWLVTLLSASVVQLAAALNMSTMLGGM